MTHGKVVVVTGAGDGLGRATARAFAECGARVALLARGREGLAAAADEVERAGSEALAVSVDVSGAKAVEDAAQQVVDAFGHIEPPQHPAVRLGVELDARAGPAGGAGLLNARNT